MQMDKIELKEKYIVLSIPEDSVGVTITAKVLIGEKITEVSRNMDFAEVRAAFKEAEEGYVPPDALFTLTDKGRAYLEELERQRGS